MTPTIELIHGDCIAVMRGMADNSVDAVVTDPPYGLAFMGKRWDYDVPSVDVWRECLRVLKPGGHLLSFAGTRTYHRMAVNIEDAGFDVRDMIAWVYGSGFPKSHNLSDEWAGWGTALKPALEPICVARKPFDGTVAANVLEWGTGALNVDACRVATNGEAITPSVRDTSLSGDGWYRPWMQDKDKDVKRQERAYTALQQLGRWPANLIHDGSDEATAGFPDTTSGTLSPDMDIKASSGWSGGSSPNRVKATFAANTGSAARFFYCAKASKRDRDEGLEGFLQKRIGHNLSTNACARCGKRIKANGSGGKCECGDLRETIKIEMASRNHHPTVKPTDLMRYLCRLITPPGGVVLDPFTGSGSTGKGAVLEGFCFIGIERDAEYIEIARARIEWAERQQPALIGGAL